MLQRYSKDAKKEKGQFLLGATARCQHARGLPLFNDFIRTATVVKEMI